MEAYEIGDEPQQFLGNTDVPLADIDAPHDESTGESVPLEPVSESAEAATDQGIEEVWAEVRALDPELLESEETRKLVELGAQFGEKVTGDFGTPDAPKWASGTHETGVFMSYHNGGEDGHTSVGAQGVGVPRNVLVIAKAVNDAAGSEVYTPPMRARSFYGAEAHDSAQLCGRALLPEGQGEGRGDERLSAEAARDRYLSAGGDEAAARQIYDDVMATAFNPVTGTQNVDYTAWHADPSNAEALTAVLEQELTAAADLLGPTRPRGPLGAVEYSVESLCLAQKEGVVQQRLRAQGIEPASITDTAQLLDVIAEDEVLRGAFADTVAGQSKFFSDFLRYSDEAIRTVCGQSIDDLFPGRLENAATLAQYAEALRAGEHPRAVWQHARQLAGYQE